MGEYSKVRRSIWYTVIAVVLAIIAVLAVSYPSGSHGEVNEVPESPSAPVVVEPMGLTIERSGTDGYPRVTRRQVRRHKIRGIHHRFRFTKLDAKRTMALMGTGGTGPCYRVDASVIGDNPWFDEIVIGAGHFHTCLGGNDWSMLADNYTYANQDHHESWLWGLKDVQLTQGHGYSVSWCANGPCARVEYFHFRYTWQWSAGFSLFGQEIKIHKTLYAGCTLRGAPGGWQCGTGDVS